MSNRFICIFFVDQENTWGWDGDHKIHEHDGEQGHLEEVQTNESYFEKVFGVCVIILYSFISLMIYHPPIHPDI